MHNIQANKVKEKVKEKSTPPNIPPQLDNTVINLIKKTCIRMMCKEIVKINDVTTKTSRLFIELETIKGVKWDWLFDTGAAISYI